MGLLCWAGCAGDSASVEIRKEKYAEVNVETSEKKERRIAAAASVICKRGKSSADGPIPPVLYECIASLIQRDYDVENYEPSSVRTRKRKIERREGSEIETAEDKKRQMSRVTSGSVKILCDRARKTTIFLSRSRKSLDRGLKKRSVDGAIVRQLDVIALTDVKPHGYH
ncbi:hypothetical protein V1477_011304 [Vespula maculifrons]|uniref:Uncharacterized protein n=1 Tax=Vespula maculifrons TaxID=7453 RepID=A0ABD2C4Y2_VESMC